MKSYRYISIILILGGFISGCETTERIDDFPLRPSRLVVNCFFTADSAWDFQLSNSLSVLDNAELHLIKNAKIMIYEGATLIDTITKPDEIGWYSSINSTPESGKTYTIEVTSPDYDQSITATEMMPGKVPITNVTTMITDSMFWDDGYWTGGNVEGMFNISFSDPAGVENYYEISVLSYDTIFDYYNEDSIVKTVFARNIQISSTDASVSENKNDFNKLLISDHFFDGQDYQIKVKFVDWQASRKKIYEVSMVSLNRSGYLYKKSLDDYSLSRDDPFSEPVQVYCNIENGYGIFSGYSNDNFQVALQ